MPDEHCSPDLAMLGFDDLRDLAKHNGISTSGSNRADLVIALRAKGIGLLDDHVTSKPLQSVVNELLATIATLMKEMATFSSLKEEVQSLRKDLETIKSPSSSKQDTHTDSRTTTLPPSFPLSSLPEAPGPATVPAPASPSLYSHVASAVLPAASHHHTPSLAPSTVIKRAVTSYYHKPPQKSNTLCSAPRVKCKALYLGNVSVTCSADSIAKWCEKKKVTIIKCSVTETKYFGTAFAHLVIREEDLSTVQANDFWPGDIRVREWRFKSDRIRSDD